MFNGLLCWFVGHTWVYYHRPSGVGSGQVYRRVCSCCGAIKNINPDPATVAANVLYDRLNRIGAVAARAINNSEMDCRLALAEVMVIVREVE